MSKFSLDWLQKTISYSSLPTNSTGKSQVQSILINSMGNGAPFILKYGKVTTSNRFFFS